MKAYKILHCYFYNTVHLCSFLLILFISQNSISQQLAFPSAYGAGAYTVGGRGGTVSHVTTLADSGPGSLRSFANVSNTTIIFDVSGVIHLKDQLYFTGNNVTIAGQTAPLGGITIDNHRVVFLKNSQMIVRYIRFRGGYFAPRDNDTVSGYSLNNVVFDHCSFSFALDEALSIVVDRAGEFGGNVTVQNCLLAESNKGSIIGAWSIAGSDSFKDITMVYNVFYNITHRHPNLIGSGRSDIINNYIHNAKFRLINARDGSKLNQLNNVYDFGSTGIYNKTLNLFTYIKGEKISKIYTHGNQIKGVISSSKNNVNSNSLENMTSNNRLMWKYFYDNTEVLEFGLKNRGDQLESAFFVDSQYPLLGLAPPIIPISNLKNEIVMSSGASRRLNADGSVSNNDDDFDATWKLNIMSSIYEDRIPDDQYAKLQINISSNSRSADFYKSNPHIPEIWFSANVPEGKNHNDIAPSGYTWLEEYLNGVDRTISDIEVGTVEVSPNSADMQLEDVMQLTTTFSSSNTNKEGRWTSSNERIATVDSKGIVKAIAVGEVNITFSCTEVDMRASAHIKVFPKALQVSAGDDQTICTGTSATLTATGGSSYLWSTGAKTASITVSPKETTTYTVTAFDSTGKNSDEDDVIVIVNSVPKVNAGNNITINAGESTILKATGATSYKWSTGETSASINVSPTATKTYTVTGIRNGCEATDTVRVTVVNPVGITANAGADQSICTGTSAMLTATGGSSYLWNTGAKTASITVSPKETSTYTVIAFDSSGKNSDKDEVKVTVNPLPSVDAGSNRTIDSGQTVTLTASGAATYKWSTGATGPSITVSPTATQTYTVTGSKNGCEATATVKVTVKEPVVVVARAGGNQDVCEGGEVTLTATGGERYLWSTGATTASIKVNPKTTTKYSVTAYVGDFSGTDEAIVKVSPKPKVVIVNGSEATVLEGEFITLSAKGANSYKWSNGATQPNIAVRPTKTKTYDVVGYVNDCSSERSIKVNVYEKVVANAGDDVAICSNETTVLTAKGPENSKFLWSTGETTKSITVGPDEDTEYSVMVYHDLDSDTDSVMVNVRNCVNSQVIGDSVTIEDTEALDFLIHPNPTDGEVHIKISGMSNESSIHLYDLSGKSLYYEAISVNGRQSYNKTLDLSEFASGIYLLQLINDQKVITNKIVLK